MQVSLGGWGFSDAALHSLLSCMHTGQSNGAFPFFDELTSRTTSDGKTCYTLRTRPIKKKKEKKGNNLPCEASKAVLTYEGTIALYIAYQFNLTLASLP